MHDELNGVMAELDALFAELADRVAQLADRVAELADRVAELDQAVTRAERLAAVSKEDVPPFSMHIHGSHLMPVETLEALGRLGAHVKDLYEQGWRPGEPWPAADAAPAAPTASGE